MEYNNVLREYGHSLPIADGHPKILFVFMHGSHHAWKPPCMEHCLIVFTSLLRLSI